MSGFNDLISDNQLRKAIDALGYTEPTPVQARAIPKALMGKNLLVSSKTGSGKTATFLLPCLEGMLANRPKNPMSTRMLILTPTRELARQIVKNAEALTKFTGITVGSICGGEELKYQKAVLRKNPEIVVGTPGRLAEHVAHHSTDFSGLEYLILDEADRMLDMGLSEDVLKITESCATDRQTLLFSATLEQRGLRHLIKQVILGEADEVYVEEAPNLISQEMVLADDAAHKNNLLAALLQRSTFTKAIVFANTKVRVDELEKFLRYSKLRSNALHGDITQDERKRVLQNFRDGKFNVLVATDVAARGLDIQGVDLIVNVDMAYSGDEYLHRIGRTGRADREGRAVSFVTQREWNLTQGIARYLGVELKKITIPGWEAKYKGPDKVKNSGKSVGFKKKETEKSKKAAVKPVEKVKVRERDKKNVGKRRAAVSSTPVMDGFAPPPKRKPAKLTGEGEE
jgi:ATP-dependent RNA helicase SrmB